MTQFSDENALWDHIAPRLRGKWSRLEAVTPEGMPDAFGLWRSRTIWLELKIGKPSLKLLRPKQHDFLLDCEEHNIEAYVCFGHQGHPKFCKGLAFHYRLVPEWYLPRPDD